MEHGYQATLLNFLNSKNLLIANVEDKPIFRNKLLKEVIDNKIN